MSWQTGLAVYFVMWWISLFMVLPWGVRRTENPEEGHDRGAPARPMLVRKLLITTVITLVVFGVFYLVVERSGLSLQELAERYAH